MVRGVFVTGTDTGVGKTLVSQALLTALADTGRRVAGMKPVASGCDPSPSGFRSADAEALLQASNIQAAYPDVNPYAFGPATAPHLAAEQAGIRIEIEVIRNCYERLARHAETVIVEGVGGWSVPISGVATMMDVARSLGLPVILVVGMRLGAINHALLTQESIRAQGCMLAGWVANHPAGPAPEGYVTELTKLLSAPCLGIIPPDTPIQLAATLLKKSACNALFLANPSHQQG